MVRFVIAIGILAFLGFMLWVILPAFEGVTDIINATANVTALELAQWNFMPLIIAIIIVVCVIWHYFGRSGTGGDEQ